MVPRNKRTLQHIPETLFLFISGLDGVDWTGDRDVQRRFEEMLEDAGLKADGQPYDPNSGGARTYKAQLECLGLLFLDDTGSDTVYRPTLAGEAILEGDNPWRILRWQLMKFQYPSPYSKNPNVKINPQFKIRPFYFLLRLLRDDEIGYLTQEEVGKIVIVYGRSSNSYDDVKQMILNHRDKGDDILPDTFIQDSTAPRIKRHSLAKRKDYLEDKANIFFNYLESTRLVIRPDERSTMEINPEMIDLVEEFEDEDFSLIDYPEKEYRFQRKFGLPPNKRKDTRKFRDAPVSKQTMKERLVMKTFYEMASTKFVLEIDDEIIDSISESTSIPSVDVEHILEKRRPQGLEYFEERYLDMAAKGQEESTEFEKATAEIFEKSFGFIAKHVGQIVPQDRAGGNPDVVIISEDQGYCAIIDAKAYLRYTISNDHRNRMLNNYIPNYNEHVDDEELEFFLYVSGGFGKTFNDHVENLAKSSGVDGAGITARNLINLSKLAKKNSLDHADLKEKFSQNQEITVH